MFSYKGRCVVCTCLLNEKLPYKVDFLTEYLLIKSFTGLPTFLKGIMKQFVIAGLVFAGILKLVMYIYSITHDDMAENNPQTVASSFAIGAVLTSVLAGGIAGTSVDIMLFPIDAIKTRL